MVMDHTTLCRIDWQALWNSFDKKHTLGMLQIDQTLTEIVRNLYTDQYFPGVVH